MKKMKKQTRSNDEIPIVGIGASAGGLEALNEFVNKIRPDSGLAYIIVVQLMHNQPSMLPEILQRHTTIPLTHPTNNQIIQSL